jgi:flagellar basal body-associated protein FliL
MATDVNVNSADAGPVVAPEPRVSRKTLLIGGVMGLMALVPAGAVFFIMRDCGSAEPSHAVQESPDASHAQTGETEVPADDTAEVAIGDFNCSNGSASPGSILHVDFKMSALTSPNRVADLERLMKSHQARIRGSVNRILRGSSLEELNDPNLFTIRRSLREELNRLLRKTYVAEVVVTDFRVIEQ